MVISLNWYDGMIGLIRLKTIPYKNMYRKTSEAG